MRHDFSLRVGSAFAAAIILSVGCSDHPDKPATPKNATPEVHPSKGPHGGALAEWGEENYHAEFTVDHAKKQATVYILDGSAKKEAPIPVDSVTLTLSNVKPSVKITLKADPQDNDPKGQSSRFRGTHDALATDTDFEGEIAAKVGGTPFSGEFKEKADAGHKSNK